MSATGTHQVSAEWRHEAVTGGLCPDAMTLGWLTEDGLLTRRLRSQCGPAFSMRVLRNAACATTAGLHREVLLCCGDQPCIYAVTDVPAATLHAHDWLARLGDGALGEVLQGRADVSRSPFEFALLSTASLPPEVPVAAAVVWARRSDFRIGSTTLTVTEVFLPALGECGNGQCGQW